MTQDNLINWLDTNYKQKIQELQNQQQSIIMAKELEFKEELMSKSNDYRDVKFGNITHENKIDSNNLLQKFRYSKDLSIEKKINEIIETAQESLNELINTHETFCILYYSNLIRKLLIEFPEVKRIICPNKIEFLIPKLEIEQNNIVLVCSKEIEIGIIGELENNSVIHFSPEIMYSNNKDEIRMAISKLLFESG